MLFWTTDNTWRDTLVVRYYPRTNEHKLVFRYTDELLERVDLSDQQWRLYPTKWRTQNNPVLDGAIVEFKYSDGKYYRARVYQINENGDYRVAYLDTDETDVVPAKECRIVVDSPCVAGDDE